jgi:hypothetical protein
MEQPLLYLSCCSRKKEITMADDKSRPNQQTKKSSDDPVEGRRDVPSKNKPENQRKYDVDKLQESDYSSDDPTEGRRDVTSGKRG